MGEKVHIDTSWLDIMTPEDFELKMKTLLTTHGDNTEALHIEMDRLMCKVLSQLGYEKGVEVFKNTELWYS